MATHDELTSRAEVDADALAVIEHAMTGKPLDPEVARRVRERSERATEELRRRCGTLDVAVDLIRETRDEEGDTWWIPRWP
jgi:hypothetical protein